MTVRSHKQSLLLPLIIYNDNLSSKPRLRESVIPQGQYSKCELELQPII